VNVLSHWSDELAFHEADGRRRTSAEVDLGATWRWAGSNDAWRVAWVRDTGELYVCRADSYDGSCSDVSVVAVLRDERELDAVTADWREHRTDPGGLAWLFAALAPVPVAC